MRTTSRWIGVALLLAAGVVLAEVDLADFDSDLMRGMDDTIKVLEPDVAAKNAKAAMDDLAVLRDGFKWTEQYFAAKGNTPDAVQFARDSQALADEVKMAVTANDFDAAAAAARLLAKSCKTCHEVYKP